MYLIRVKFRGQPWADGVVLVYDDVELWRAQVRATEDALAARTKGSFLILSDTQGHRVSLWQADVEAMQAVDFAAEMAGAERTERFRHARAPVRGFQDRVPGGSSG